MYDPIHPNPHGYRPGATVELLTNRIYSQIGDLKAESKVEVIVICDNKEISIGEKRNRLYTAASGEFSVQIDDDDDVAGNYVLTS